MDFSSAFQQIKDSVVIVKTMDFDSATRELFETAIGSGVVLGDGKKVLTCSHCIASKIVLAGQELQPNMPRGDVIFNDPTIDIAIIQFQMKVGKGLNLKDIPVSIGEEVFAVGFPLSIPEITALSGNIAGYSYSRNREIEYLRMNA